MNEFAYGHGYGFGPVGIIFWILIIGLIVWAVSQFAGQGRSGRGDSGNSDPLEILKRRYAQGEIDKPEYEQRRRDLKQD